MKQLLQNLRTGQGIVADVPAPLVQRGRVLVRTAASLISAGTERAFAEFGRQSLVEKAKERPDLVKTVVEKVKSDGLLRTVQTVREKLDESHGLGYSAAGIVAAVGEDVTGFRVGDRVACAGAGYATHAEMVSVPKNLCVHLPEGVDFEAGAFATVGAIALQGVRLAEPTLGESVVVIGLGLLGQLTSQLLKANGCRVFGVDLDEPRLELAARLGIDQGCPPAGAKQAVREWTRGRGADAVIITAASSSNQPVELAGEISRVRGRVIAVGLVGMSVPRNVYYQRELSLKVSMSYGPGRYDPEYEERGHDYPFAYVRWTEGRNIEAFLDLLASRRVQIAPLITHRFKIDESQRAYRLISGETEEPYLGIIIEYDTKREVERYVLRSAPAVSAARDRAARVRLGLIGAGDYARKMLLPHFKENDVDFISIATASGVTARDVGKKYGFARLVSGGEEVVADPDVNLLVVATRHDTHAELARRGLERGLDVLVEKPLALNDSELDAVLAAAASSRGRLVVGFNRRFSPQARAAKDFFAGREAPLSILYRVNAGRVPQGHWTLGHEGGGRIIGEVCHFVDFMQFITGSLVERVYAEPVRGTQGADKDSVLVTLKLADGSIGTIAYLAGGDRALAKERVEIFGGGRTFVIDDFRSATSYHDGRETRRNLRAQDKGQRDEVRAICAMVREGGPVPVSMEELIVATRATFRILESLRTGEPKAVTTSDLRPGAPNFR